MDKEKLQTLRDHLLVKYMNGPDYIRNNPNLSPEEVCEHFTALKDLREIERRLEE